MKGKIFTVVEAQNTLPLVRVIVRDVMDRYTVLRTRLKELRIGRDAFLAATSTDPRRDLPPDIADIVDDLRSYVEELEGLGCFLKDPEIGLVDFYGEVNGEIVYLCWRHGEDRLRYYHGLHSGYSARQLLPPTSVLAATKP
jgi:hypothetical protein